jgi:hypothetical protein
MPRNIARRSTVNFHRRVALILATGSEMPDPCDRCKKEGLRCVVELSTGYCAYCIRARSRCSLVFSDTERGEIDREERAKRVLLLQAEADAARLRLELELRQRSWNVWKMRPECLKPPCRRSLSRVRLILISWNRNRWLT